MKRYSYLFSSLFAVAIPAYAIEVSQGTGSDIPANNFSASDSTRGDRAKRLGALLRQLLKEDLDGLTILSLMGDAGALRCDDIEKQRRCLAEFPGADGFGKSSLSYMTSDGGGFKYVSVNIYVDSGGFCIDERELLDKVSLGEYYDKREGHPIRNDDLVVDRDGNHYAKPDSLRQRSWVFDYKWKTELRDRYQGIWLGDALAFVNTKLGCIVGMSAKRLYLNEGGGR